MSNYPSGVTDSDFDLPSVDDTRRQAVNDKQYLGDGVFVYYDSISRLVLQTENGYEITNQITLEPEVTTALLDYIKRTPA